MDWPALANALNVATVGVAGIPVTYKDSAGASHTTTPGGDPLKGVFDHKAATVGGGEVGKQSEGPWVGVNLADLPEDPEPTSPADLRRFVIGGVEYRILKADPDGQGHVVCRLFKVANP